MKDRDFQTYSLFAVLAVLTVLFVMGSRLVLLLPSSARVQGQKAPIVAPVTTVEAQKAP